MLVRLSIKPSANGALPGLFPMLSNGSTAMCLSVVPKRAPLIRERTDGTANASRASNGNAARESHQRDIFFGGAAAPAQALADARSRYFCTSPGRSVAVGAE